MTPTSTPESATETGGSAVLVDGRPAEGRPAEGAAVDGHGAGLRASDAERHAVVAQLQDAVARGLLTTDEGSERMAAAYDARYLSELPQLTADLPAPPVPLATMPTAPGWRALLAMVWVQLRTLVAGSATGKPSRRRLAAVGGIGLAIVVLLVLGAGALHGVFDGPHGHADGFAGR